MASLTEDGGIDLASRIQVATATGGSGGAGGGTVVTTGGGTSAAGGGVAAGGGIAAAGGGTAASGGGTAATGGGTAASGGGTAATGGGTAASGGGTAATGGGTAATGGGTAATGGGTAATGGGTAGPSLPQGWLFTSGNKVHVSDGHGGGPVWVGRGVNIDDAFLCGYNSGLSLPNPDATLTAIVASVMRDWKPTFLRVSLGMNSYTPVSWTTNPAQYATPMTNVIKAIGTYPNTYVLVTLRTDASMTRLCTFASDATCLPASTTASDALYRSMVDTFASMPHVLLGITNEPGGQSATDADLRAVMSHAVTVIRAEEDRLGVPHHVVSVQGNSWTSRIGFYDADPLPFDNVVYEYHSYPPEATGTYGYTWSHLPVIIGEYGPPAPISDSQTMTNAGLFHADLEAKQIPSLAWDISPYSDCGPDLAQRTMSTTATSNAWGATVQAYLLAHAP